MSALEAVWPGFASSGVALPVPTQAMLQLTSFLSRWWPLTLPLILLAEGALPALDHLAIRRLPRDLESVVVVAGGLLLSGFASLVGAALHLTLFSISRAVGP